MPESTEADRFLLKRIAAGDDSGWSQLVARYHGRLLAFARGQLRGPADAEDLVQETFVAFLQNRARFDPERSVETYLFTTLRRRIIDTYRGRASKVCLLGDADADDAGLAGGGGGRRTGAANSAELSASWYARRDEQADRQRAALARAMENLVRRYKDGERLRELQILELLFYAQLRNQEVARLAGVEERAVAVLKHRWLHELADGARAEAGTGAGGASAWDPALTPDSLLTDVWEGQRLTCPKRSTIGRHLLGTLDEPWRQYVARHLDRLGCRFCRANADDLRRQTDDATATATQERLYQSTIGFFRKT
jgi:RNA polymerase sigma factor (sigma-70 family)